MIPNELLDEFKRRMHIVYDIDDENLKSILENSYAILQDMCGSFDLTNVRGKFLVMEHARYTYNDDAEFFFENFAHDLNEFAINLFLIKENQNE